MTFDREMSRDYGRKIKQQDQSPVGGVRMSRQHRAEQELAHIQAMILQLEHLGISRKTIHANTVLQPDYWRTRIHAVLALPDVPRHVAEQGIALLARLDGLSSSCNCAGHNR